MQSAQGILWATFVCPSEIGLDLGDANSRVLTGLVVAWMPFLLRILLSGLVTPLIYGKTAKPFWESGGFCPLNQHSH